MPFSRERQHRRRAALGTDIKDLDDTIGVGGDAGEVRAVQDRSLQRPGFQQVALVLSFVVQAFVLNFCLR